MPVGVECTVVPMLSVRNGALAIEFYKSAFGAIEIPLDITGRLGVHLPLEIAPA